MNENPNVTIVIPNYNHGDLCINAIKSVIMQDYNNTQLIIIDDCSTDNSVELICEFLQMPIPDKNELVFTDFKSYKDVSISTAKRIFLLALSKNKGRSAARNEGIKALPDQDIYGFLDADDQYLPGKISKSVDIIKTDPDIIGVVYSDYISYNLQNKVGVPELRPPFDIMQMRRTCLINNDSIVTGKALRAVTVNGQTYDEEMEVAEDYDLWLKITARFVAIHIPELLVMVGVTENNATKSVPGQIWQKNWGRINQKMSAGIY